MIFASLTKIRKDNQARYFPWLERGVICLSVLSAYASVWPNAFLFDDKFLIVLNSFLKHWSSLPKLLMNLNFAGAQMAGGFYRPVQMLAYFFIYQAFGASTVAFHALNIALQALNACLLHHFGIRAGFRKGAAFAAALLWAMHPLHTTDVTYMSSTAELLWSSFCLLGLITLLPDFTPRKIWLAMIFFILALGCKESAVVFPALAATTFFFVSKERAQAGAYLRIWPLWLLSACYIFLWLWFMHKTGYTLDKTGSSVYFQEYTSNITNRVLTSLATLPVYAWLIIWPSGLHFERVFPICDTLLAWQPATGTLMVGLCLLQILYGRARRGLALSFGLLWFAVALSPTTGIIIPVDALISESWMYLPTMGLFLGVAQTVAGLFEKRKNALQGLVLVLAVSLGVTTFFQNEVWRNPETLYQNVLQNGGRVNRLSSHLGLFYMQQGEFDKAVEQFQHELSHPDGRDIANIHFRLAMALLHTPPDKNGASFTMDARVLPSCRHIPEAIDELEKAVQINPDLYWVHIDLAIIYHYQGNDRMDDFHQRQAVSILQKLNQN